MPGVDELSSLARSALKSIDERLGEGLENLRSREVAAVQLVREIIRGVDAIIEKAVCGAKRLEERGFCSGSWFVGVARDRLFILRRGGSGFAAISYDGSIVSFHRDRVSAMISAGSVKLCYRDYCEEISASSASELRNSVRSLVDQILYLARHVNRHVSLALGGLERCRELRNAGC